MACGLLMSLPAAAQADIFRWDNAQLIPGTEGILPALESAHALAGAMALGCELGPEAVLLVSLSGRGDKDVHTAARWFGLLGEDGPS